MFNLTDKNKYYDLPSLFCDYDAIQFKVLFLKIYNGTERNKEII